MAHRTRVCQPGRAVVTKVCDDAPRRHAVGHQGAVLARESLAKDLRALGVPPGQVLLVHASMRRLGWVGGGASEVVAALREVLGQGATLVVPTFTADNSDTSRLYLARTAAMTPDEVERYRDTMPPFTFERPSIGMGRIAEHVRLTPGAVRSEHPQTSFAALGPQARMLMAGHRPDCHLGEYSPLGRLYGSGAWVLLLGVGYAACSCFHLAEYRYLPHPPRQVYRCVITEEGMRRWRSYEDVGLDDRDFAALGAAFDRTPHVIRGYVGQAECRLVPIRAAVDFAVQWLRRYRLPGDRLHRYASAKQEGVVPAGQ
jgi:aminoglycoside 3-N-acetyltransferase